MTPDQDPSYLKVDEAARFLRVTPRTIYRRIWSGALPASKVGGLYYIKQDDLEAQLDEGRVEAGAEVREAPLKCGQCYRLLLSDAQIGELCQAEGCEQLLCTQCISEGLQHCAQHAPSRAGQWDEAYQRQQNGELQVLVKASTARLREINFLNRIQSRIANITTLVHPLSSEVLTFDDWDAYLEQSDERAEVMRLLGKVILDASTLAKVPLNAQIHYHVPKQKKQKGPELDIFVKVLSRLPKMVRDGFDSRPLGADDLAPWLVRLSEEAQQSGSLRMAVLASVTGWDASARQVIEGEAGAKQAGTAFAHRQVLFYLFDLEKGQLLYNQGDERVRRYAELFAPLLPSEEIDEAIKAMENELLRYDSLTLEYASQALPYPKDLIQKAFERLAGRGRYDLIDTPESGVALIKR